MGDKLAPFMQGAGNALGPSAALYSGIERSRADLYNSRVMGNERTAAINQGNAQANLVANQGRRTLGTQAAAFGGAGVGYTGSSATALDRTAVNSELEVLNTRYKAAFTGYGYGVESGLLKRQAGGDLASGLMLAGGRALQGLGKRYTLPPNYDPSLSPDASRQPG